MRNRRYKLSLRRISSRIGRENDLDIEIKLVDDIKMAVSGMEMYHKLILCLGPYEIGTINTYSDDFLHFKSICGIISYHDNKGSGYILSDGVMKLLLDQKITLEEFIEATISQYYDVEVVKSSGRAWHLLQMGWKCASRVKSYINPLLISERNYISEERLIFINRKKQ